MRGARWAVDGSSHRRPSLIYEAMAPSGGLTCILLAASLTGCAVVPAHRREHLADPTMQATVDPVEDRSLREMHTAREGASGGDDRTAGGGCACSN